MAKRIKILAAVVLVIVMMACLCACAQEDGLKALEVELPDGTVVDMMEQSSVTVSSDNIGKEIHVRGTKVMDGEEISKELKTYELKEGYNDITVYVSLSDEQTDERTITIFVELEIPPLKSGAPSEEPDASGTAAGEQ